jgi:glycosyltransferase involved in cell wall biosynthesis
MPEITIIITAYKDRGWIEDAILSAKNQTFRDYDIMFVSDGNPWLENYATSSGIPFICYPKSNYASMVNNAVTEAKGNWIKILHDDDLLTETCLEDLYGARGGADLVYGNAFVFNNNDKENYNIYQPPANVELRMLLPITSCPVNFEAELFLREAFLAIGGFDTNLGYSEDYDLLINWLDKGYKVTYCDKNVVWYRHHERQITGNEPAMREKEQAYLMSKYMDKIVNQINWNK